jgi:hypothetical protein
MRGCIIRSFPRQLLSTMLRSVFMTLPILMVVLVIGLYGYIGNDITASMAFTGEKQMGGSGGSLEPPGPLS